MSRQEEARPIVQGVPPAYAPIIGPATQGLGEFLVRDGKLKSPEAFQRVRGEALDIVRRCKPFTPDSGTRTGLVVGYVQSGKTMSMTTVASLARDNGCRIVVLLAGVTTNLLRQNASRFRETLRAAAGGSEDWQIIDSEDGKSRNSDAQTLRHAVAEWNDSSLPAGEQRTLFLTVLKNHSHLDWLGRLLAREQLATIPALILDDEADQAGLNVGGDEDPSKTYLRIQQIRAALPNHTYLQYTATPQAPLLISIDDMLSPEFAELVEPGDDYTGGEHFFPKGVPHPHVINIPSADLFKPSELPEEPPPSLLHALATFFVGSAVARVRQQPKVRSMLIHPSQRTADQAKFFSWAQQIQKRWADSLRDEHDPDRGDTLRELEVGYHELQRTDSELPPFDDLLQRLKLSLTRTMTKKVNSEDGSEVDWASDHILVGGEKLNRGYTVEGLMVTYMPRDAGGWNADTIQQRARFFGYKRSYFSLCRIYLHPDIHNAYSGYVVHERDVRRQLKEHRGRPLRDWRRAFFLDAKMRPTRTNVLSDPLFRVKRDKHWFVQRFPHVDEAAVAFNEKLIDAFVSTLAPKRDADIFDRRTAETTIDHLLSSLLLDFKAARETATWYAHLVSLSDLRADSPSERVVVVFVEGANGAPRERSPDSTSGALTLHQGRSSRASAKADDEGSDKKLIEEGTVTLQVHTVLIKGHSPRLVVRALALYIPRPQDAIAGGTIA
jgi:hypothetical protein